MLLSMGARIGIDTGGTFTDFVLVDDDRLGTYGQGAVDAGRSGACDRRRSRAAGRGGAASSRSSSARRSRPTPSSSARAARHLRHERRLRGRAVHRPDGQGAHLRPALGEAEAAGARGAHCYRRRPAASTITASEIDAARARRISTSCGRPAADALATRRWRSPSAASSPICDGGARDGAAAAVRGRAARRARVRSRTRCRRSGANTSAPARRSPTPSSSRSSPATSTRVGERRRATPAAARAGTCSPPTAAICGAEQARSRPAQLLLSRPRRRRHRRAASTPQPAGYARVFTLDMGGTSCDIGLVLDGEPAVRDRVPDRFGIPVTSPASRCSTIGAGGGSIAWIDKGGLLHVGPAERGRRARAGRLRPRRHRADGDRRQPACSAGSRPGVFPRRRDGARRSTPPARRSPRLGAGLGL